MFEVIFLICLGLVWIIFAVVQDSRKHEVANWLNFSLIIFALGFRFFWSLFSRDGNSNFFFQGLIGLGIFFVLGNLFYYGRIYAGGDAKLMIALGAVLPVYYNIKDNLKLFLVFLFLFLFAGAIYGLVSSFILAIRGGKNFRREFAKQFLKNKKLVYIFSSAGILISAFGFYNGIFLALGIFCFIIPYLYLFAKSVDESCMIKQIDARKLTEGDWLYKNVKIGKKLIRANWDGLSGDEIRMLVRARKKVFIRQGIPYTPVFLIAFLILNYVVLFTEFSWVISFLS